MLADQLAMHKEAQRRQIENLTTMILEVSKKVDDADFRIDRVGKAQESLEGKVTEPPLSVKPTNYP